MDLLTLAALCGPWVAPATTVSIIEVESAGRSYAIHDNTSQVSFAPRQLPEAMRLATALIRAGHRLDLGLMQINYDAWLRPTRVSLLQAFNPCLNIAFGTTILSAAYAREARHTGSPAETLQRALSVYNSGDAFRARDYANRVIRAVSPSALHLPAASPSHRTSP
jgi:type IV secretion system protein VirB1